MANSEERIAELTEIVLNAAARDIHQTMTILDKSFEEACASWIRQNGVKDISPKEFGEFIQPRVEQNFNSKLPGVRLAG